MHNLTTHLNKTRMLTTIEDIKVDEILKIYYVFRQEKEPSDYNFTLSLTLKEWKQRYLKVQMAISKPLLVS